jgi:hypothetical protein
MMDEYDKKYGVESAHPAVQEFHRKRRMFCINNEIVYIAPESVTYTHAVWFENMGWMTVENDRIMENLARGYEYPWPLSGVKEPEIYCYVGYDLRITAEAERTFFAHLREIAGKLSLPPDTKVFGGLRKTSNKERFLPIKEYGRLKELESFI